MSEKRKVKLILLDEWELEETESWLNDFAKDGWLLERMTTWTATFVEAEPVNLRYRLEIASRRTQLDEEQIELYEDAGWEYITNRRYIHVFREQEANTAMEIHTDAKMHAETLERLKKSVINRGIVMLFLAIICILQQFMFLNNPSSFEYLNDTILSTIFSLIIFLYLTFYMLRGMIHMTKLMKKLKNNQGLNHEKPYRTKLSVRKVSFVLLFIFIVVFPVYLLITSIFNEAEYEAIPDDTLPVVSLHEIENISLSQVTYSMDGLARQRENSIVQEASIFVPEQYQLSQRFMIPSKGEAYEPYLRSNRYEARTEGVAIKITDLLKEERAGEDEFTNVSVAGFDEVALLEYESFIFLIARAENMIYDLRYFGEETSEQILALLEELL